MNVNNLRADPMIRIAAIASTTPICTEVTQYHYNSPINNYLATLLD